MDKKTDTGAAAVLADIDSGDEALTANQVRALFPGRNGNRRDVGNIHRLFTAGSRSADGQRVRLEFAISTSGRVTTKSAVARFNRRLNCLDAQVARADAATAHAAADAKLAASGW